jgi:hypothetical protein
LSAGQGHADVPAAGSNCGDNDFLLYTDATCIRAWICAVAPVKRQMLIVASAFRAVG